MKPTLHVVAVGTLALAGLPAQTPQPARNVLTTEFLQQAQSLSGGRGGGRGPAMALPRAEKGKPFSATVTTQSVQTLADGTRVTQSTTTALYRDAEGRVRTETTPQSRGSSSQLKSITIRDSVAGVTYLLDPVKKTAARIGMAGIAVGPAAAATGGPVGRLSVPATQPQGQQGRELPGQAPPPVPVSGGRGGRGTGAGTGTGVGVGSADGAGARGRAGAVTPPPSEIEKRLAALSQQMQTRNNPNETTEDLGIQIVNGVPARGARVTTVVPVGAIGNDREFRSVSERWFSDDLNLLIKSVSSDPRFGTTTYEMTNIIRAAPDTSLFQVPSEYTFVDGGGRGQ